MQTPGHALINLATLGSIVGHEGAVLLGAVLPDVPIMVLYLFERLRGTPEDVIWSVCYQKPLWLAIVHGGHSIPLSIIAIAISLLCGMPGLAAFFGSVLLHALGDLPVHAIDAHRHFLPFSQYRFISPLSYWDPRFHGKQVAFVEWLLVAASSIGLIGWRLARWPRGVRPYAVAAIIAVNLGYARNYWRNFLRA